MRDPAKIESNGPYDRGATDIYYGRRSNPHKRIGTVGSMVPMRDEPLTDPQEIEEYNLGYSEEMFGRKLWD